MTLSRFDFYPDLIPGDRNNLMRLKDCHEVFEHFRKRLDKSLMASTTKRRVCGHATSPMIGELFWKSSEFLAQDGGAYFRQLEQRRNVKGKTAGAVRLVAKKRSGLIDVYFNCRIGDLKARATEQGLRTFQMKASDVNSFSFRVANCGMKEAAWLADITAQLIQDGVETI